MAFQRKPGGGIWLVVILALIVGVGMAIGTSLAITATDQARFCGGCHSMSEAALTHAKSIHAKLSCNECHAPYNPFAKTPFKLKEGLRDIPATALGNIPDLIHAGERTREVIQENCLRCHGSVIESVNMTVKSHCTDCHRHVPHTPKIPIAKRSAADA